MNSDEFLKQRKRVYEYENCLNKIKELNKTMKIIKPDDLGISSNDFNIYFKGENVMLPKYLEKEVANKMLEVVNREIKKVESEMNGL